MRAVLTALALTALVGCFPSFEDRPWLVQDARIVAVRGTPAEARPGEVVNFEALVASPDGTLVLPTQWAFCLAPRSVEERTGVTASCAKGDDLEPINSAAPVLADACARFGPNPPPTAGNEQPLRPADPDPTGGYYLPMRALVTNPTSGQDVIAFGFQRIRCDLAGATRAIFEEFQDRYTHNVNPTIAGAVLIDANGDQQDVTTQVTVAAGETLTIRMTPAADAAEAYVHYDVDNNVLRDRIETLTTSWNVSAGELTRARQTIAGDASTSEFETQWTAPASAGAVTMWIVLRDARGGSTWLSFVIAVV